MLIQKLQECECCYISTPILSCNVFYYQQENSKREKKVEESTQDFFYRKFK